MSEANEDIREPHLRSRGDFLGAFGVVERDGHMLFVANERRIDGRLRRVWDLPGGQVEPGELLEEALRREFREELGVEVASGPRMLFLQEGDRLDEAGARLYAWRSFFFDVDGFEGEPKACGEVHDVTWLPVDALDRHLDAPYHVSFLEWLAQGRSTTHFRASWCD